jgi:CheY-like chemotaxis protein
VPLNINAKRIKMKMAQPTWDSVASPSGVRLTYHEVAPRVLVVAKDARFRRWASAQLRKSGFEMLFADDGFDAAHAIADDPPALIVIDHNLSWYGVTCLICLIGQVPSDATTAPTPILLVTPQATASFVEACHALGIAVLVRRPRGAKAILHVHLPKPHAMPCVVAAVPEPACERSS